jgi:hypothetical protein
MIDSPPADPAMLPTIMKIISSGLVSAALLLQACAETSLTYMAHYSW